MDRKIVYVDADLEEIVPIFLKNREDDLKVITGLIERGDFEGVSRIGHKIRGDSGGYGFNELGVLGDSLENCAKNKNLQEIKVLVEKMKSYLAGLEIRFKEVE